MSEIDEERRESVAEAPTPRPEPAPPPTPGPEPEPDGDDPFEGWPQPQSAAVIEDVPPDGGSVEHVRGEIDVPNGYTVIEGTPTGRRRSVAVVVSRFNGGPANQMLKTALEALEQAGGGQDAGTGAPLPRAVGLPPPPMGAAERRPSRRAA